MGMDGDEMEDAEEMEDMDDMGEGESPHRGIVDINTQ